MITSPNNYNKSKVLIGERLGNLTNYLPDSASSIIIITDEHIENLYGQKFPDYSTITIGTGEKVKTQKTVDHIINELIKLGGDRHTYLVGIGGGVVCDLTGFVASIYMRGISFGYVSTTILSQVDASIGGKTGINFNGYKNMVGVFSQPDFVICDIQVLKSLPVLEVKNGLAEIIKHGIISNPDILHYIKDDLNKILEKDVPSLEKLISMAIQVKADIVTIDTKEKSERKKLNLGHTIGHAIESIKGIPHGQAIGTGIAMTAKISESINSCSSKTANRIIDLIDSLGISTSTDIETADLMEAIQKDKKKAGDKIDYIIIEDIGKVRIERMSLKKLEQLIEAIN